ncbi:MAG: alpha-L-fucosidase [Acidobacteria bacterium]|nr:alpha-L-fucosidase [Acidobacteriota bacterium]
MDRRRFVLTLTGAPLLAQSQASKRFEPTWESLRKHTVPDWYRDAKLGIFIHWGLYSVPAFAPPSGELGKVDWTRWFFENPYAEWYLNTLRLKKTPTYEYHVKKYGADFDYYNFKDTFNTESARWDPKAWASLFRETGARYAVLTTKHHDGFTLWPSRVPNPKRPGLASSRDIVGELTTAVRQAGLKMGLYYSGGLDWTFEETPVAGMGGLRTTAPQSEEYAKYADAHWRELIDRYQPSILWNDITYPGKGRLTEIFADYFNRFPEGLVNNRFGVEFADITTPEYSRYDKIVEKPWETCRGLGFSFGYNAVEGEQHVIARDKLVHLLIDVVSRNGNLLINAGPRPDGSIPDIQTGRLRALGEWMKTNSEAIHGTRTWNRAAARNDAGEEYRFTRKGDAVYAFALSRPAGGVFRVPNVHAVEKTRVELLGKLAPLEWKQNGRALEVTAPTPLPGDHAWTLKITPEPYQLVRG